MWWGWGPVFSNQPDPALYISKCTGCVVLVGTSIATTTVFSLASVPHCGADDTVTTFLLVTCVVQSLCVMVELSDTYVAYSLRCTSYRLWNNPRKWPVLNALEKNILVLENVTTLCHQKVLASVHSNCSKVETSHWILNSVVLCSALLHYIGWIGYIREIQSAESCLITKMYVSDSKLTYDDIKSGMCVCVIVFSPVRQYYAMANNTSKHAYNINVGHCVGMYRQFSESESVHFTLVFCFRNYLLSWLSTIAPMVLLDLPLYYASHITTCADLNTSL